MAISKSVLQRLAPSCIARTARWQKRRRRRAAAAAACDGSSDDVLMSLRSPLMPILPIILVDAAGSRLGDRQAHALATARLPVVRQLHGTPTRLRVLHDRDGGGDGGTPRGLRVRLLLVTRRGMRLPELRDDP